jgi:hypothetical protein
MTPEGRVKSRVKAVLNASGCYWFMPIGGPYSTAGVPDFVGSRIGGGFFGLECKAGKGKMTALQERQKTLIEKAGGKFFLVNEIDGLKELGEWLNASPND